MSARELLCRRHAKGAGTCCDGDVDGGARHEEVVREAKVKPLPILRMMVTTRPVVRGRGHEPQPQSPSSRLAVLHSSSAPDPPGRHSSHPALELHPKRLLKPSQVPDLPELGT